MAERAKGKGSGFPSMASSPTASSCSSSSSPFASSFYSLPVMALRGKIVEKVMENRVTLIVGETGCGKSSQVPQFLLEERIGPILCTQPRRFAVVAVAGMVAKARNCEVGDEVGYHIGRSKVLSARSKIIFKTAGVLLDEMREKGLNALNYKAIILDEVHERSVESDLVLVCVKQYLLKNNDLRLVLMSATADISRYRDYFKDLGRGERVEVLAIPSSNQQTIYQRRVLYLEQVIELIGISSESCSESLSEKYCSGSGPLISEADIKPEVHNLIHKLVLHIHEKEPDIRKSILVFLPTYYALEKQWHLLEPFRSLFKVHILHRSIDTKEALVAMKIWKSHRKVILATNIAESSVTIPEVAYVIDSCRSLQVFWDSNRKIEASELVWVSKSQAEQRRGRTGRTCDGQVYRLVTSSFYAKLQDYELPSILRLSLRQQILLICCAESKAINDPKVLLQKALDPPDPEVVEDAFRLLIHFHALEKTHRGRYEPTFYGRLLASFSLSFDASLLILKLGNIGLLREGILLGILMDTLPLPIIRPFGQENLFTQYTACYFTGDNVSIKNCVLGKKELMLMANLCAFEFWQRAFMDKHRLEHLKQIFNSGELKVTNKLFPKVEEEWCSFHNLVQSSLHHVAEIYDDILSSLHRYRPGLLAHSDGLPSYYEPYEFQHTCLLKCQLDREADAIDTEDEHPELPIKIKKCITVPFVGSNHFRASDVAEKLATTIKEMRVHYAGDRTGSYHEYANGYGADASLACGGVPLCRYFLSGSCNRGGQCWFSHSLQAKRPACKFFFSMQGCRNGESCFFSHDPDPSVLSRCESIPCLPDGREADAAFLLQLLPTSPDSRILLLDDADLRFSGNFSSRYDPSKIISTTPISDASVYDSSVEGVRILWGLSDPQQAIMSNPGRNQIPWNEVRCVLWFPSFEGYGENSERQRTLVAAFFECLAIRILGDSLYEVRVIVTMNNIRFSRLEVERLGRDCFFFLTESFPFDESAFGDLRDTVATKRPGVVTKAISYVFDLCPPADLQFGDYTTAFYKHLHDVR